jgi:hypothetical protein
MLKNIINMVGMIETIILKTNIKIPKKILTGIYKYMTTNTIISIAEKSGICDDDEIVHHIKDTYKFGIPTKNNDLTEIEDKKLQDSGVLLFSLTNDENVNKIAIKYLIMKEIKNKLNKEGYKTEINISDIHPNTKDLLIKKNIL